MSSSQELKSEATHVVVRKPSALDLTRILQTQRMHKNRLIACINKDKQTGMIINEVLDPQNDNHVLKILSLLAHVFPDRETIDEVIVYSSDQEDQ